MIHVNHTKLILFMFNFAIVITSRDHNLKFNTFATH